MADENQVEKQYLEHSKYITVAVLATSIAIISGIDAEDAAKSQDLKIAITIFAITIPYLIWDVFFINIQQPDGNLESTFYSILRVLFCLFGCVGIAYSFNELHNYFFPYPTFKIFLYSFGLFFLLRFFPIVSAFYNIRRIKRKGN